MQVLESAEPIFSICISGGKWELVGWPAQRHSWWYRLFAVQQVLKRSQFNAICNIRMVARARAVSVMWRWQSYLAFSAPPPPLRHSLVLTPFVLNGRKIVNAAIIYRRLIDKYIIHDLSKGIFFCVLHRAARWLVVGGLAFDWCDHFYFHRKKNQSEE